MKDDFPSPSGASRRDVLLGALAATVAAGLPMAALAQAERGQSLPSSNASKGATTMSTITTKDGTEIYYKDWGTGPGRSSSHHGWPLNADAWDGQMLFLAQNGFRVVAHDRRGHGRSTPGLIAGTTWTLCRRSRSRDRGSRPQGRYVRVGHSTGGGEVARYIGRHGSQDRVAKLVLIGCRSADHAEDAGQSGRPADRSVRRHSRQALAGNRSQFYQRFRGRSPFTASTGRARSPPGPLDPVLAGWQAMHGRRQERI